MKNKLLVLLLIFTFSLAAADSKPYVLLISFDGFRWDFTEKGLTPNLNEMAGRGVKALSLRPVFPSKTFPNHLSIITGLYPENHGIIMNHFLDPFSGKRYRLGDSTVVQDPKWYNGEALWETAQRQGVTCASYFWPGSELTDLNRRPKYIQRYDHGRPYEKRIDGIINWLKLPYPERPHFLTLYFHETDSQGHDFGPESPQNMRAVSLLDSTLGILLEKINQTGLADSINIIVLSDHGMTDISAEKTINIEKILEGTEFNMQGDGPVMMIDSKDPAVLNILQKNAEKYRVYTKSTIPGFYHFSRHPFISEIILVADPGYSLINNWILKKQKYSAGNHGYEKDWLDMHGIFIAAGPAFKNNYRTGTLWNIDINPLICEILEIQPARNIDGDLQRIGFLLKE